MVSPLFMIALTTAANMVREEQEGLAVELADKQVDVLEDLRGFDPQVSDKIEAMAGVLKYISQRI